MYASLLYSLLFIVVVMANQLSITAWNIRSLSCARPYINELLHNTDILVLSEHRLFSNELYKLGEINTEYDFVAKASQSLDNRENSKGGGHSGIAVFWKKYWSNRIKTIETSSDRICAIEILNGCHLQSLFVIGVYMPQQASKIAKFNEHLTILESLVIDCKSRGEIVIIGDFNCHFGTEAGNRCWGKTTPNAKALLETVNTNELYLIDCDSDFCRGPTYTFYAEGIGKSYIDHVITSSLVKALTIGCDVLQDCLCNTSDHLPLVFKMSCERSVKLNNCCNENEPTSKVKWHKVSDDDVATLFTGQVEDKLKACYGSIVQLSDNTEIGNKDILTKEIDCILGKISKVLLECGMNLPCAKFKKHLKPYWNTELNVLSKNEKKLWHEW